jgi:hypothetical protein
MGVGLVACVAAAATAVAQDEPAPLPVPDAPPVRAMASLRDGFESDRPEWRQEEPDVTFRLLDHDRTGRARREGQRSERFRFQAEGTGSAIYYSLPLPKVPLVPDLEVSLYARSNQAGVQLLARVVLPADVDPDTARPSYLLVPGTIANDADRWERLELPDLARAVEEQARIRRVQTGRRVSLEGAYVERLVVNLYGGPGETEVFLDDLTVTPVPESVVAERHGLEPPAVADAAAMDRAPDPAVPLPELPDVAPAPGAADSERLGDAAVTLEAGGRLMKGGRDWVPTILAAPGADVSTLLPFGFDVVMVAPDVEPEKLREAARRGALLMPDLGDIESTEAAVEAARGFAVPEAVALWHLGSALGASNDPESRKADLKRTRALVGAIKELPPPASRLTTATVGGEFTKYAMPRQNLALMGVAAGAWGAMRGPYDAYEYLLQRRQLTALFNAGAPYWAWIDAAPPKGVRTAVWGDEVPPAWGSARVQPEQVRIAAYVALMAGYRGVGLRGDSELTRPAGRAVLYELGLLNAEIDLVEPILARGADPILGLQTYPADPPQIVSFNTSFTQGMTTRRSKAAGEMPAHPTIRGAAISTSDGRGRLILLADLSPGAQWQPPQMALNDLMLRVPGAPDSAQAFELSLGGMKVLDRKRTPGGVQIKVPEFGVASMVLLTTDFAQAERIKRAIEAVRPQAVDLAIRQARAQSEWVGELNARLANDSHGVPEAQELLSLAARSIESAEQARAREDYPLAWDECRRATRPLRVLMRAHWNAGLLALDAATKEGLRTAGRDPGLPLLVTATSSPPLTAFNTLPQHFVWCDWARFGTFGTNVLPAGGFDDVTPERLAEEGWTDVSYRDDRLNATVKLAPAATASPANTGGPTTGQVLTLNVQPADPSAKEEVAAFLDHPAAAVRTPPIPVEARQFLRIRVRVRMPRRQPVGAGGLIVRDSLGGETLQFRSTEPIPRWADVVLYRRVPADGELTITLGFAGYGEAQFDDLQVERLERYNGATAAGLAADPAPPSRATQQPPLPIPAAVRLRPRLLRR